MMAHYGMEILGNAFIDGTKFEKNEEPILVKIQKIGYLTLTSGYVAACDPLTLMNEKAFLQKVPQGKFPVHLSIAHIQMDQRVAFAKIQFSEESVTIWKMATIEGQSLEQLKSGYIFGYGVDSGTGCFADIRALQCLRKKNKEHNQYYEYLIEEINKHYQHTWSWTNHIFETAKENILMFSSGFGDGFYASYWGYSAQDKVVCLVTDFGILPIED